MGIYFVIDTGTYVILKFLLLFQMRHLFLILDMSQAMTDQDLKPTRMHSMLKVILTSNKYFLNSQSGEFYRVAFLKFDITFRQMIFVCMKSFSLKHFNKLFL